MKALHAIRALQQAARALTAWRLRSVLIVSAVALAITSLTVIVATMEGAAHKAMELAVKFGPTAVTVYGGDVTGQALGRSPMTLTWKDLRALETRLPNVERVSPYLYREAVSVQGNGRRHIAGALGGSGEDHGLSWGWPLARGRDFTVRDVKNSERVCFLGARTAEILFEQGEPLGATVLVEGIPFLVVGIHSVIGLMSGAVDMDDRVTVPITTMARCFNISREHLIQMRVTFPLDTPETSMPDKVESVRAVLRESHGFTPAEADDFLLFTADDMLDFLSILKGSVVLFLGVTAVTAALVSGFVLANLFHLAVTQRQEEIGLKKALGATGTSIMLQFMFEALLLCLAGGLLGLLSGLIVCEVLQRHGLLTVSVSGFLFMAAFVCACGIGVCFAYSPARRAAGMQPVTALRGGG